MSHIARASHTSIDDCVVYSSSAVCLALRLVTQETAFLSRHATPAGLLVQVSLVERSPHLVNDGPHGVKLGVTKHC